MIADAAGITGLDPRPLSLRFLLRAANSRLRTQWDQTAQLLWMMAEVNRDRKQRPQPYAVADFHPMLTAKERREIRRGAGPKITRLDFIKACVADLRRHGKPVPESLLKEIGEAT